MELRREEKVRDASTIEKRTVVEYLRFCFRETIAPAFLFQI